MSAEHVQRLQQRADLLVPLPGPLPMTLDRPAVARIPLSSATTFPSGSGARVSGPAQVRIRQGGGARKAEKRRWPKAALIVSFSGLRLSPQNVQPLRYRRERAYITTIEKP